MVCLCPTKSCMTTKYMYKTTWSFYINFEQIQLRAEKFRKSEKVFYHFTVTIIVELHCESRKTRHLTLAHNNQILTNFQNSFTIRLTRKFVTKSYTNTPPHPKRVATLPCEISVFKKSPFLRSK